MKTVFFDIQPYEKTFFESFKDEAFKKIYIKEPIDEHYEVNSQIGEA